MDPLHRAEAYWRLGRVYIAPQHLTQPGFLVGGEPVQDLDEQAEDAALGGAVRRALAASQSSFPWDPDERNKWPPMRRATSTRSWTQFIKGTRTVQVHQVSGDMLKVFGRTEDPDEEVAVHSIALLATDDSVGALLRQVAALTPTQSGRKP